MPNMSEILAVLAEVNKVIAGLNEMGVKVTGNIDLATLLKLLNVNAA